MFAVDLIYSAMAFTLLIWLALFVKIAAYQRDYQWADYSLAVLMLVGGGFYFGAALGWL